MVHDVKVFLKKHNINIMFQLTMKGGRSSPVFMTLQKIWKTVTNTLNLILIFGT